jgi:hypothetical protein
MVLQKHGYSINAILAEAFPEFTHFWGGFFYCLKLAMPFFKLTQKHMLGNATLNWFSQVGSTVRSIIFRFGFLSPIVEQLIGCTCMWAHLLSFYKANESVKMSLLRQCILIFNKRSNNLWSSKLTRTCRTAAALLVRHRKSTRSREPAR